MSKCKREFLPLYSFYDRTGIAAHLEKRAAEGWLIEKMSGYCWTYRHIEPQALRFAVTYFPKATQFAPYPADGLETFREFCAEAGWILAADNAQVQIFYNENLNPTPIETDPESDFRNIHSTMQKSFLKSYWALLLLSLFESCFLVWQLFDNPIDQFSSPLQLNATLGFLPLFLLTAIELVRYYRWCKRTKAALETGDPLPELRSARWLSVLILLLAGVQVIGMLTASTSVSPAVAVTMAFMLVYMILMAALTNSISQTLRKLRVKSWVNKTVSFGVVIALSIGAMGGMMALIFKTSGTWFTDSENVTSYESNGHTFKQYHDPLPLTVQDLVPGDYDSDYWSTQLLQNQSTFLLEYIEANQRPRLDAPEELPRLSYEIVIVKAPFLYNLCKQDFIDWLERDNDKLPPEYWDEYILIDAPAWGASEVYQEYSFGEARNHFLVCWPDRIVEISFPWEWEITQEIIAVAAAVLKNA